MQANDPEGGVLSYEFTWGESSLSAFEQIEQFLVGLGFLTADSVIGFYGPLTESAVRNFQAQQGIVSSVSSATGWGVVGPRTAAAIVKLCSSRVTACTEIALTCPYGMHDLVGQNCSHSCVPNL